MLDKLGLSFAVVFLLLGSILLYDAVSKSDLTQTARVIGGAVFLALGLVTLSMVAKRLVEVEETPQRCRKINFQLALSTRESQLDELVTSASGVSGNRFKTYLTETRGPI